MRSFNVRLSVVRNIVCFVLFICTVIYVYDGLRLDTLQMRARDYSDLRTRKVLSKLDELLSAAAHGDAKDQSLLLGEAHSLLNEQLGVHNDNGADGVAGVGYSCGENIPLDEQIVCPEKDQGSHISQRSSCFNSSWALDLENCHPEAKDPDWSELITVIIKPKHFLSYSDIEQQFLNSPYGSASFVIANTDKVKVEKLIDPRENVKVVDIYGNLGWQALARHVETPYVLVARDLHSLSHHSRLERSLRILSGDPTVGVVAGAIRNLTGHWQAQCGQVSVQNYQIELRPGYRESRCDCMSCGEVGNAPFVTRTKLLKDFALAGDMAEPAAFLSFFLDVTASGLEVLLCPDIMYLTFSSSAKANSLPGSEWKLLAKKHKLQGVVTDTAPKLKHSFTCDQVGLSCSPRSEQTDAHLLPWCCIAAYAYILKTFDAVAQKLGVTYELDAGSILGAVKIGHYIPWDIDGDIYISTEDVKKFSPGSSGKDELEAVGINVYRHRADNYADKGAGYFMLWKDGIEVEMLGRRGSLSTGTDCEPELRGIPTLMRVSGVWVRAHANPGLYSRSRYGSGYLRHAQSWRYSEDMEDSFQKYNSGARWRLCPDPSFHGCLEHHPVDGNVVFHQDTFQGWKVELDN